jgi:hypothetical protein
VPSEPGFREGDTEGNTRPEMGSVSAVPPVVQREAAGISPLHFLLPRALYVGYGVLIGPIGQRQRRVCRTIRHLV